MVNQIALQVSQAEQVFLIGVEDAAQRLDLLVAKLCELSRTQAATLIANGNVTVNGRRERASYKSESGDSVAVVMPEPEKREILGEDIPITTVYEDEYLLVVDKPAGMVVHPAPGNWTGTLVNALLGRRAAEGVMSPDMLPNPIIMSGDITPSASETALERAGIVHRLDKETSGLLIVAKTDRAHRLLSSAIAARRVNRHYAVMIWGHLDEEKITVNKPIDRDKRDRKKMAVSENGRTARTDFERLARFQSTDLLRAKLHTGRTHQIRVHAASIGHPVVGDDTYGGGGARKLSGLPPKRHFLHAAQLKFRHPITNQDLDLRSELPNDLKQSLIQLGGGSVGSFSAPSIRATSVSGLEQKKIPTDPPTHLDLEALGFYV